MPKDQWKNARTRRITREVIEPTERFPNLSDVTPADCVPSYVRDPESYIRAIARRHVDRLLARQRLDLQITQHEADKLREALRSLDADAVSDERSEEGSGANAVSEAPASSEPWLLDGCSVEHPQHPPGHYP